MPVPTRLARYPFFEEATEAVEEEADGFDDIVSESVLERAAERVVSSIEGNRVGEMATPPRVELFSYPVARAVVSLVDEHALTRRYAWAESLTARDRFEDDLRRGTTFGSVEDARLSFEDVVDEFGLEVTEEGPGDGYGVDVSDYLELASGLSDEKWKLVNRSVDDGVVGVSRDDLLELAREGVRQRVADDLPLDVPDEVRELVAPAADEVQEALADTDLTTDIEVVEESEFPPCMKALLTDIREGEHLEHHSRFAITAFLTNIGMTTDEIVDTYEVNPGFGEEMTRYQTDHIQGETGPIEYTCPSCSTMVTYGDCRNRDELCETISHPLGYYRKKIEAMDREGDENGEADDTGGEEGEDVEGSEGES
ncbi:MAG: DNA primase large subunit PriL [Halobacteria archaeon]|nr:DNA primase large subunit PriL [Halobacteria archaeon]